MIVLSARPGFMLSQAGRVDYSQQKQIALCDAIFDTCQSIGPGAGTAIIHQSALELFFCCSFVRCQTGSEGAALVVMSDVFDGQSMSCQLGSAEFYASTSAVRTTNREIPLKLHSSVATFGTTQVTA
jgi:hypothetical protein